MGFGTIDLAVVLAYLAAVTFVGFHFRHQRNIRDYFLGGRSAPWWAISLSIVATETSTLTVIGTPAIAYGGNLTFLQLVAGYIVARILVSWWLLPSYFEGEQLTAYGYIERRFGGVTRRMAAGLFLVTRVLADAVRIWAIAIVVQLVLPRVSTLLTGRALPVAELTAVLAVVGLTLLYTFLGGMRAVIWTDAIQFVIYLVGGLVAFVTLIGQVPGGLNTIGATAFDKLQLFDFSFSWEAPYTFWAGLLGGTFLSMASHGTDQMMVQRLLAARNLRDGRRALVTSGFLVFGQFFLFLLVGIALYVFYLQLYPDQEFISGDHVFPSYMVNHLPPVMSGLMVAGVLAAAMSTSSSTLNSLSASTIADFYQPLRGNKLDDAALLRMSRWLTVAWGGVLVGLALLAKNWGPVLEAGLAIASVTYGALLGLFLLGRFAPRVGSTAAALGMGAGLGLLLYVRFFTSIAWTWYVVLGSMATFLVGWSLTLVLPARKLT